MENRARELDQVCLSFLKDQNNSQRRFEELISKLATLQLFDLAKLIHRLYLPHEDFHHPSLSCKSPSPSTLAPASLPSSSCSIQPAPSSSSSSCSTLAPASLPSSSCSTQPAPSLPSLSGRTEEDIEKNEKKEVVKKKLVKVIPWWGTTCQEVCERWNLMSKNGDYSWEGVEITWKDDPKPDYYFIICAPKAGERFEIKTSIVAQMEPHMGSRGNVWGQWANPDKNQFFRVLDHATHYNNMEWHLGMNYQQLKKPCPEKTKLFSAVISGKYFDPGHRKRIDFLKFLESKGVEIDIYGQQNPFGFKGFKGPLELYKKEEGLIPYKYTFNAENHSIRNYITEKLVDSILSECCLFYWGCPNVYDYLPMGSFVMLDLVNFEYDYQKVMRHINNNSWEKMRPKIIEAKHKILDELQFFPMLNKIINNPEKKEK